MVENHAAGLSALSFLREREGGRGTFIPLDVVADRHAPSPSGQPGVLGRAVELVRISPGADQVVEALLGRAWIVSDLESALALRATGVEADLLTLGGETLFGNGILSGGRSAEEVAGALHQRREIEELANEVTQLELRAQTSERNVSGLRAQIARSEESLRTLSQGSREKEVSLAHQQQDVRRMTEQLHATEERLARLAADRIAGDLALAALTHANGESEAEMLRVEGRLVAAREAAAVVERSLEQRAAEVQLAQGLLMEIQVKLAADRERRLAAIARSENLAESGREIEAEKGLTLGELEAALQRAETLKHEEQDLLLTFRRLQEEAEDWFEPSTRHSRWNTSAIRPSSRHSRRERTVRAASSISSGEITAPWCSPCASLRWNSPIWGPSPASFRVWSLARRSGDFTSLLYRRPKRSRNCVSFGSRWRRWETSTSPPSRSIVSSRCGTRRSPVNNWISRRVSLN